MKDSAFTGAVPLGHGGNRARPGRGRGRPAGPSGTGRTAGRLVSAGRRLLAVADALPVTVLAVIAGAGSFTHIRDTAAQHGQGGPMSWAVAVCIDLTCVMAARERQRDKQQGVVTRRLSWPAVVLAGGVLLSLAANLAQAQPTAWGRIVAAVPPAAFLVAVSMIERRAARRPRLIAGADGAAGEPSAPGRPSPVPEAGDEARDGGDEALLAARAAGRRRAPGPARPADHPRRAARPPRRVQPGRLRAAAPAPRRRGPAAGNLPRRLTPAASPHRPAPLVRGEQAGCRRGVPAREFCPAGAWRGRGSTGTAKAWQPTGTGSPARPLAASTRPPGPQRDRPLRAEGCGSAGAGHGQRN